MNAIQHWQDLADRKARFALALSHIPSTDPFHHSMIRETVAQGLEAGQVAESLRMQESTGIPHCSCTNPPHPLAPNQ